MADTTELRTDNQVPAGDVDVAETDGNGHVHFPVEQVVTHESQIQIMRKGNQCHIHLGFLQHQHLYQVTFDLKDTLDEDIVADPLQNLHVKMESYKPTEDGEGHELVILFKAHKEKIMQEQITIKDSKDSSKTLSLVFHARVLAKGQGTPALRNGIHCLKAEWDDESEHSDWQGFN